MAQQDDLELSRDAWNALNAHDIDRFIQYFTEDVEYQSAALPHPIRGRGALGETMRAYIRGFPDLRFTIEQMLQSGEYVITRWKSTGTHKGEFMGIPPTGRAGGEIHGCNVGEIKDGKVTRLWSYWDSASLLRQLGVLPGAW